jgi:hypothetical protein
MVTKWEDIAGLMNDLQDVPTQEEREQQQHEHDIER